MVHNNDDSETDKYITKMLVYTGGLLTDFMKIYWTPCILGHAKYYVCGTQHFIWENKIRNKNINSVSF